MSCMLVIACSVAWVGCGQRGQHATVGGRISWNGKPVPHGLVMFRPTAGISGPEFAGTVANGNYNVPIAVLPGDYDVEIRAWKKTGRIVTSPFGTLDKEVVNVIPRQYWGPGTQLSARLHVGNNTINFDLNP